MPRSKRGGRKPDKPKGKKTLAKEAKLRAAEGLKQQENEPSNGKTKQAAAEALQKARIGRPTPECYPHIVATFGTNENKVHENARTIQVENLSIAYHGADLLKDTDLTLSYGQRYGLMGMNGCGKSTLLRAISAKMVPIPDSIDTYTVERGMDKSDKTALEAVLEVDDVVQELEKQADELTEKLGDESLDEEQQAAISDELNQIYEHLDELGAETAEMRAGSILSGLGFTKEMQKKQTKDFSGGWRMRISLARALYLNPTFLILDEPTNHLDMEAVVWFEEYLKKFKKILLLVSHSQDFLNGVCTNIILLRDRKLEYYGGNYDTYVRTRQEKETMQMKRYEWEQDQVKHMKEYIARFGHGSAKLAKQAQSKEKTLAKMTRAGLTEKVKEDRVVSFTFVKCGKLPPPVLQLQEVSFAYPNSAQLYNKVDFGMDLDSRIALVGPNGAGKSTMLNLLTGELHPTDGMVRRHHHLKMSKYAQHFVEELPLEQSPLKYMMTEFPKDFEGNVMTVEKMRSIVGRFGITGPAQTMNIEQLSDGQVSRLAFARIYMQRPHLLLLDEPTNHLDIESIDSLADAINEFDGGMCLVSHDMRLISQVAKEIWICDKGTLTRYTGSIMDFKLELQKELVQKEKREKKEAEKERTKTKAQKKAQAKGVAVNSKAPAAPSNGELKVNGKTFSVAEPYRKDGSSEKLSDRSLKEGAM